MTQPVLINGEWVASAGLPTFQAVNPATQERLPGEFPVSPWSQIDTAIQAAADAAAEMRGWPGSRFAEFLNAYAEQIEIRAEDLIAAAHAETALPVSPRLKDAELPRTTSQLRQAAAAAQTESWRNLTIDTAAGIRSMLSGIGPVVVFGPNNFPFAFNGIAGGDFAAAVAAGNPVIAKGHSGHPETTRVFAEAALLAAQQTKMPTGFVQLIYRTSHEDGYRLVSDRRIGATGYTGARYTGLKLKAAADAAGIPIYLELSSINPIFVLPGALRERAGAIAEEFTGSCLMGTGQFCTNPGLVVVPAGESGNAFLAAVAERFGSAPVGTMLSEGVRQSFAEGIQTLQDAGATLVAGGEPGGGRGVCFRNTLLKVSGKRFLDDPEVFQTEAFGNGSLFVMAEDIAQMIQIARGLEGNLTGCVYSDKSGSDDDAYNQLEPALRTKVGRLLNDKMPTGVAVSPAMNHGGPYPSTGHPGFTAVGIPASVTRFAALQCYDNIRPHRLPEPLRNENPHQIWRRVDGVWTTAGIDG
ncbi:MAG: aldehyde dehydrogenase (NADP(+)) [Planctomycetaceae bacterium]|nr:aldehyde dehydrogenase (NADP(+)) [Planctomycetaceae bacterium]